MKSIITSNLDRCYLCGKPKQELHHVIYGKNRRNSDADGLIIPLCFNCHKQVHAYPKKYEYLKQEAQRKWEELYGDRDEFIKVYRKSYL